MQVNIHHIDQFGTIGLTGVHQVCEQFGDFEDAFHKADRDGFDVIHLYVIDQEEAEVYASEVSSGWGIRILLKPKA